ncbi:MAG: hypothetical protein ACI9FN_001855 [Saprospiraceae bacterium]|jgi:hypothetical protein
MEKYTAIKQRALKYKEMLQQVVGFRNTWEEGLKDFVKSNAEAVLKHTDTTAQIEIEERFENLESITISLGKSISGIAENVDENTKRNIVKDKGSLVYSQLFNGKVQAWMTYPIIEGLMQPKEPKMIGIYSPPEFNEDLILSNFDDFFKELIEWENYDDDQPGHAVTRIGFGVNPTAEEN